MIGIEVANVYFNFPEIMKEEYKDLWEFINEEHIVAKDVTQEIEELKEKSKSKEYVFVGKAQLKTKDFIDNILAENKKLLNALDKIRKYIHSEEFFMLMNSGSINDKNKSVCEDYFKAQKKLDEIIEKASDEE